MTKSTKCDDPFHWWRGFATGLAISLGFVIVILELVK